MNWQSFLDNMKLGFEDENQRISDRQARSTYRNVVQRDEDHYNQFAGKSDSVLLQKYNSLFTSETDKTTIARILESRGYEKHKDGTYGRR